MAGSGAGAASAPALPSPSPLRLYNPPRRRCHLCAPAGELQSGWASNGAGEGWGHHSAWQGPPEHQHPPLTHHRHWGTLSLPHTPPSCPVAGSRVGRTQIHLLQHCPATHETAEVIRDGQAGAQCKPLGTWEPSPMPVPMHTRHPRRSLAARWVCRRAGRQTGPGPLTSLPNSPAGQLPRHLGMKVTGKRHCCVAVLTLAQTLSSPRATARWLCSSPSPQRCQQLDSAVPWGSCGSASSPTHKVGAEGLCQDPLQVPWGEWKVQWGAVGSGKYSGYRGTCSGGGSGEQWGTLSTAEGCSEGCSGCSEGAVGAGGGTGVTL